MRRALPPAPLMPPVPIAVRATALVMAALVTATLVTGCATGPKVGVPDARVDLAAPYSGIEDAKTAVYVEPGSPDPRVLAEWWRTLDDPLLDRLLADALDRNLDLDVARARLRQARARRRITGADRGPSLDATGVAQRQRISENIVPSMSGGAGSGGDAGGGAAGGGATGGGAGAGAGAGAGGAGGGMGSFGAPGTEINFFQASFDARWEVDLFGSIKRRVRAADARVDAAELAIADVRVSLAAEFVRDYVGIRELQTRLAVAGRNLAAVRRTAGIVRERDRAGFATALDTARADAAVLAIQALVPQYEVQIRQGMIRLAVLAGRSPGTFLPELEPVKPVPIVPRRVAVGIPSELLRRRPDIRNAERNLAAAIDEVGGAVGDLYPSFTFDGSFGFQADSISRLVDWGARFYTLGFNVLAPIFDSGRLKATIELRRGEVDEALARYRLAVLGGFQDVEDALVAFARDQDQLEFRQREEVERLRAVSIAQEQYRAGLVTLLNVLEAQETLFTVQDQIGTVRGAIAADWAAVQKSLGGGWVPRGMRRERK